MNIVVSSKEVADWPMVVPCHLENDRFVLAGGTLPSSLLSQAREDGFTAQRGTLFVLRPSDQKPATRIFLVGLGKKDDVDGQAVRVAAAAVARFSIDGHLPSVQFLLPAGSVSAELFIQCVTEGVLLGTYSHDSFKSKKPRRASIEEIALVVPGAGKEAAQALSRGRAAAEAVNFVRDLINRPPSDKRPTYLAGVAKSLAGHGVTVRVFQGAALKKMGAHALLGVGRGSAHPPALVHLRYRPSGKLKGSVALVGKGVTFDSGGLSLKPADGMMTMKYDMAGAATVLGVFKALKTLRPPVEVHGVTALTENMPGPDAYKPGDVLRAMNGKTIEVLNTDAEGRVILADALSFATRLKTDAIVDVATLTGAASVALGKSYAALMSNTPTLEEALRAAGTQAGEKLWPLPLEKSYMDHIQSKVADFKNMGNPGEAGTIMGGLFLQQFVEGPWAHIDMASVGWQATGTVLSPAGATGAMVRTLLFYVISCGGRQ